MQIASISHDRLPRYLYAALMRDPGHKILLVTGPRPCGKTTLSHRLADDHRFLSHDLAEHRLALADKRWTESARS